MRDLLTIVFGIVLIAGGMAAGWWLAGEAAHAPEGGGHGHDHGDEGHEGHDHGDHEAHGPATLPDATRRMLGIEVAPATLSTHTVTLRVPAVVVERPQNLRAITAPFGGIVREVHVEVGDVAAAGAPLLVIARDPLPRFRNERTSELLAPVSEAVHDAVSALRAAKTRLAIADAELERLRGIAAGNGAAPVVPAKQRIEMEYEHQRAHREVENAEHELLHHGLTEDEIEAVAGGKPPPPFPQLWQRVLRRQGLWDAHADALLALVPEPVRGRPWVIAGIGELEASGQLTPALVEAAGRTPAIVEHFGEAVSLLLQGTTVASLETWAAVGVLAGDVTLRAPTDAAADWDVSALGARTGERVEAGHVVARLHDATKVWLRAEPLGGQLPALARALAEGRHVTATPLIPDSGPRLDELHVLRLTPSRDDVPRTVAYVEAPNTPVPTNGRRHPRSWQLNAGLRYVLHVPERTLENRFVLPAEAVVREGPNALVFLADGDGFRDAMVEVEVEDDRVVVIANDGALFPQDPVVVRGAFGLHLALQQLAGGGAVDPHAGHNH